MTPDQINIAIAEACGWTKIGFYEDNAGPGFWHGVPPAKLNADWEVIDQDSKHLPNFFGDLNAMHEAEATLTGHPMDEHSQKSEFSEQLVFACNGEGDIDIWFWHQIHATAAQRAEAFLKTIGKWTATEEGK